MNSGLINSCRRALVLCPHTDDEFGCAGTILRLLEAGAVVHYVALSRCEESVPTGYPINILEIECRKCTEVLGIASDRVHILDFKVRNFPHHRQEILEKFVSLNRQLSPDIVLMPSSFDMHQDHKTVYWEGLRAFKHCMVLGYELPQNLNSFVNSAFIALTESQLKRKILALSSYSSQEFRPYASQEFISALALVRGIQAGLTYAESFELIRLIEK